MQTISLPGFKRGWLILLAASWCALGAHLAAAGTAEKLPTAELSFRQSAPDGIQLTATGDTTFVTAAHRSGGSVVGGDEGKWIVESSAAAGEGSLDFTLDRSRLAGDLAVVLRADWQTNTDVAIQLFDAAGTALALDLFGNLTENGRMAATDTFIVPLVRYPQAARVSVRRFGGALVLHAVGLFPVLSELPASVEAQQEIASKLGLVYQPRDASSTKGQTSSPANTADGGATVLGTVHSVPALASTNEVGAAALSETGYPAYHPLQPGPLQGVSSSVSGTTYDFVRNAVRMVALQSQSTLPKPFFTSSNGVASMLLTGSASFGVMSVPLTSAEKEKFFNQHGFPILEFKVAHGAVAILVNASNPLTKITVPQLDAIYSLAPRAGASRTVRTWNELGASQGEIKVHGGMPDWGTSKTFQRLVLQGGQFRPDLTEADVVYRHGVEEAVAKDPAAIGYVSLRPRQADVRTLAVAANSGEKAWLPDAASIYSGHYPLQTMFYAYVASPSLTAASPVERELVNLLLSDAGQVLVARSGNLPLSAEEDAQSRAEVGLAK